MDQNYYPIEFDENGSSFTIVNNGTAPTPCVITFIPKVDFIKLTISGLSKEPIEVVNIKMGDVLVINGETRGITINDVNSFSKYNAWEFPKLNPGVNTITINNGAQASLSIEYNARYI